MVLAYIHCSYCRDIRCISGFIARLLFGREEPMSIVTWVPIVTQLAILVNNTRL